VLEGVQTVGSYTGIPALAAAAGVMLKMRGGRSRAEPEVARLRRRIEDLERELIRLGLAELAKKGRRR